VYVPLPKLPALFIVNFVPAELLKFAKFPEPLLVTYKVANPVALFKKYPPMPLPAVPLIPAPPIPVDSP
jgi:hypothetical protein